MKLISEVIETLEQSKYFDESWYRAAYKDVDLVGLSAAEHYVRIGARLQRDPSPRFSTNAYLTSYTDVAATGVNPLYHFLKWGQKEGRVAVASAHSNGPVEFTQPNKAKTAKTVTGKSKRIPTVGEDLAKKLWGGFSHQALADIDLFLHSDAPAAEKTVCLWNVARFFAAERNWEAAQTYLKQIRKYDRKFINQKRPRLLEAEIAASLGNFDKAESLISYPLKNGSSDGDFFCAMANVLWLKGRAQERADGATDEVRLEWINKIYSSHGLSQLELIGPSKGLKFGNLSSAAPVAEESLASGPKISILMPVYNAEEFIRTAVDSMLNQTWKNIEIIAVDDCSTDNSWAILQDFSKKDKRLTCFRNERNMGAYPTRNRALSFAKGDFITVHDSDDWSHPQMLEVQIRAMLRDAEIKVSFTSMARVLPDMQFALRPERNNMEYIHRSYPSLMIRRSDLAMLTHWDPVIANADDEFVQRARELWGREALRDIFPNVPFSYFLKHEASLTSQKTTNLRSLTYGVRHEYSKQAGFWREHVLADAKARDISLSTERTGPKSPFPIPNILVPNHWKTSNHYDIVIISDLSLLGGTRRCNEGYVAAALNMGLRVGLFHWPRYDLRLVEDIGAEYRALSYNKNVDILTCEEEVTCELLLIHHPPILKYVPDMLPKVEARHLGILVNQLPKQLLSEEVKYYTEAQVNDTCRKFFGRTPVWIPISPLVRKHLKALEYKHLGEYDWYPPYGQALPAHSPPRVVKQDRLPIIGRHSRDHWTKWPGDAEEVRSAYCADTPFLVRFMGGTVSAEKLVGKWPENWESLAFDSISVSEFLSGLDLFLHFTHSDYIEEFGRNIMEAMAHGVPVILPSQFQEVFGNAAVYTDAANVTATVTSLWADPALYSEMSRRGYAYVQSKSSQGNVTQRLEDALQGRF